MSPNELNEAKPYKYGKILVFDLDDTIIVSAARIWVRNKVTGEQFSLTPEEFNTFQKKPNQILEPFGLCQTILNFHPLMNTD